MNELRINELLIIFKNTGIRTNLKNTIEFQDLVGRSSNNEILEYYSKQDQLTRELFFWACSCCLSFDMFISILKDTIIKDFKKKAIENIEADYNEQFHILAHRELKIKEREETLNAIEKKQKQILDILSN